MSDKTEQKKPGKFSFKPASRKGKEARKSSRPSASSSGASEDRLSQLYFSLVNYCLFPFLVPLELFELRSASKLWKSHSDVYLAWSLQMELKNPDLGVKDAFWYYGHLARGREKITITAASKRFRITPKQIASLEYETRPNPLYRHSYEMKLVETREVLRLCLERHKSAQNLLLYEDKLAERRKTRNTKAQEARRRRRLLLEIHLKGLDLPLREGDPLVFEWLEGRNRCRVECIANRLAQVHFLHKYCHIQDVIDELIREREEDREELMDDWDDEAVHFWYHDKWDEVDYLELAEDLMEISYPEVWPWLRK